MQPDTAQILGRAPTAQAAISNKNKTLLFADGRKVAARRHRDLLAAFGAEVGGFDSLVPSDQMVIRSLARLSTELEILDSRRVNGETIDGLAYLSMANAQRRALGDFAKLKHRITAASPARAPARATTRRAPAKQRDALNAFSFGENP